MRLGAVHLVVALVMAQRLLELAWSRRNERRLRARGAIEHGRGHYPLFFLLHGAWLLSLVLLVPAERMPDWWLLGLYAALQPLRVWVIGSLGDRWSTRVLVPPGEARLKRGPYHWLRHPNYLIVAGEVPLLPLAFSAPGLALAFGTANLALLAWRIRVEEQALTR